MRPGNFQLEMNFSDQNALKTMLSFRKKQIIYAEQTLIITMG